MLRLIDPAGFEDFSELHRRLLDADGYNQWTYPNA